MLHLLVPSDIKQLYGSFGPTGYYRSFIKSYVSIAHNLTEFLKYDAFCWSKNAEISFLN